MAGLAALVIQRFRDSELCDTLEEVANYLSNNAAPRPGAPNHIWGQGLTWLPAPAAVPLVSQARPPNGPSPDLACDKENLLAAKAELIGTATGALSTWQQNNNIADFEGVTVTGTPQRVTNVSLHRIFLHGKIPARLGNLANFLILDLSGNQLTGSIPPELTNLTNLGWVNFPQDISGGIAIELGSSCSHCCE